MPRVIIQKQLEMEVTLKALVQQPPETMVATLRGDIQLLREIVATQKVGIQLLLE